VLVVSEKVVAISQGRSFPITEIHAGTLARLLSRFVGKTPVGIGLGMPETMQLAIDEAGVPRIVFATVAAALTRAFGVRGTFYRIAGKHVVAIDGPTPGTIPPYNTHAKKAPLEPQRFARSLSDTLTRRFGGEVGIAVIDANDIGADVLGYSEGVDATLVVSLFRDNPLGQGDQQTPVAIVRRIDSYAGATPTPSVLPRRAGDRRDPT
jgi:F420-0:gamma-glutamyl ligase